MRTARALLVIALLLPRVARAGPAPDASAEGAEEGKWVVGETCPATASSMALWRGQLWQQEMHARTSGQLAAVELLFIGPFRDAHVRIRPGHVPSRAPAVLDVPVSMTVSGYGAVRVDARRFALTYDAGESFVIEVEGGEANGAATGGLVGGKGGAADCPGPVTQNGSLDGLSPDTRLASTTYFCRGACAGPGGEAYSVRAVAAPSTPPTGASFAEPPNPIEPTHHNDESWTVRPHQDERLAAAVAIEGAGQWTHVGTAGGKDAFGVGVETRGVVVGQSGAFGFQAAGSGMLGGQTSGLTSHFEGVASVGPVVSLSEAMGLFAHVGARIDSYQDDALEVSLYSLPEALAGWKLATSSVVLSLAARGGAGLRAVYAIGEENAGVRAHRLSRVAPSWGGTLLAIFPKESLEATLTRIEEHSGLWTARAGACAFIPLSSGPPGSGALSLCAAASLWRGFVAPMMPASSTGADVSSSSVRLSVGYGAAEITPP